MTPEDLDRLLEAWAQPHRLDPLEAEAVRRAVTAAPRPAAASRVVAPAVHAAASRVVAPAVHAAASAPAAVPHALPAAWWVDLSARVTDAMVRAAARPPAPLTGPVVTGAAV